MEGAAMTPGQARACSAIESVLCDIASRKTSLNTGAHWIGRFAPAVNVADDFFIKEIVRAGEYSGQITLENGQKVSQEIWNAYQQGRLDPYRFEDNAEASAASPERLQEIKPAAAPQKRQAGATKAGNTNDDQQISEPKSQIQKTEKTKGATKTKQHSEGDTHTKPKSAPQNPSNPSNPSAVGFTLIENEKGNATKVFTLGPDGALCKTSSAQIYEGRAKRKEVADLAEFSRVLSGLKANEALAYGVFGSLEARLVTQEALREGAVSNAIARDRDHFAFAEGYPGVMMFDHDPRPDRDRRGWQELDAILCEICAPLASTARLWRPSASAFLYRSADGTELIGMGGWRCYVLVDDASAIPMLGAAIYQQLWQKGHGYIQISKSGALLDRSMFDASVWQPERLDFAAPPVLKTGLERRAPDDVIIPGERLLQTHGLLAEMTIEEWRLCSPELQRAKKAMRPKSEKVQKAFVEERIKQAMAEGLPIEESRIRDAIKSACERRILGPDFPLHSAKGETVTVADLLTDREGWDGMRFFDPLEPGYANDPRIAYANLSASPPYLYSHAHGGVRYDLVREIREIVIEKGEMPRATDEVIVVIKSGGDLFERGGELVRLKRHMIAPVSGAYLSDYLERRIRFYVWRGRDAKVKKARSDLPEQLCARVLAKVTSSDIRELRGVITAPTLRSDGSVLREPGYDTATGLLLRGEGFVHVPDNPSQEQLRAAHTTLWRPFAEFPFETAHDRGVMLAVLLTVFVRRSLAQAPAFCADAPMPGTGKTLLWLCVLRLCGVAPAIIPQCKDDEELRKRLLAVLREGGPGFILDNIRDTFRSPALEAFLTGPSFSDRVLGISQMLSLQTDVMVLISGNNFVPGGDLWRRMLTLRIDAKVDAPERRSFTLDPKEYCRVHRQEMVAAGLTLLRGFIAAGRPRSRDTPDRLASFEEWDDLIRQAVIWLGEEQIADVADPTRCIDTAKKKEPERASLALFLDAISAAYGTDKWRAKDLKSRSAGDDDLREVLEDIAGWKGDIDTRSLGRWLERHVDTRCNGKRIVRIEQSPKSKSAAQWQIAKDQPQDRREGFEGFDGFLNADPGKNGAEHQGRGERP
jgi:hypothetical protein